MNRTIEILWKAAERRGIHASFPQGISTGDFLELEHRGRRILLHKTKTPFLSAVNARLVTNKFLAGEILRKNGFPVAERRLSHSLDADDFAFLAGGQIAVKPAAMDRGVGVSLCVKTKQELTLAHEKAAQYGPVILERLVSGREYRILVINHKAAAVIEWLPRPGEVKKLGEDHCIDRTAAAHPANLELAVKAAELFSIDVAGIDLICPDISRPLLPADQATVLEVNPGPDFFHHLNPDEGLPQPVDELFLDYLLSWPL